MTKDYGQNLIFWDHLGQLYLYVFTPRQLNDWFICYFNVFIWICCTNVVFLVRRRELLYCIYLSSGTGSCFNPAVVTIFRWCWSNVAAALLRTSTTSSEGKLVFSLSDYLPRFNAHLIPLISFRLIYYWRSAGLQLVCSLGRLMQWLNSQTDRRFESDPSGGGVRPQPFVGILTHDRDCFAVFCYQDTIGIEK